MQTLFKTITGSRLYNLNTPDSDTDYSGFGFPKYEDLIGLGECEQVEMKDKDNNVEGKIYTIKKYFQLLIKGNLSIIEIAWAKPEYHIECTELARDIILPFVRSNFTTKKIFSPLNSYYRAMVSDVERLRTHGNRKDLLDKFGFDSKAASHAARVGFYCIQIMSNGCLNPTLEGETREICFDIKTGKYTLAESLDVLNRLNKEMYDAYKASTIPESFNYNTVEQFLMKLHRNYLQ